MQSFVYKSLRKADTYVFLRAAEAFDALPPALASTLGPFSFVIEVELSPERKLAREDVVAVMANLADRGFHLQMPPVPDAVDEA